MIQTNITKKAGTADKKRNTEIQKDTIRLLQVDGGLCIDETKDGVGPNKDGPLNQPKLKPPSKLGHPKFQRQSTETHPKPNHNRGRRFASAHPKTHVFFVVVASTQHHYHYHYKNPTWLFSSLVHFLPTSNLPLFLLSQQLHLLPPRSCLTSRASTMVILSLSLSCFDLS